jgi:DNA-binding NtrC family response regulator
MASSKFFTVDDSDPKLGIVVGPAISTVAHFSRRMLLVDDDPDSVQAVEGLLSLRVPDVSVHREASAAAALTRTRAQEFNVVLSDVHMPDMDGVALIAELKRISPHTAVVLMTGDVTLLEHLYGSGAFSFIRKPVDREYCVTAVRHAVVYHSLSKAIGNAQLHREDLAPARAGLLRLAEAELAESRRRWNSV